MPSKTIAGSIIIAYQLEPIVIQGWLEAIRRENGNVYISEPTVFEDDLTASKNLTASKDLFVLGSVTIGTRKSGWNVGANSFAQGSNNGASGVNSHAEGNGTSAGAPYAHAEGSNTQAEGQCSHAEGSSTHANGNYSHAEGGNTTANGDNSHAEGSTTFANGLCSHAEGIYSTASGAFSHAEGDNTTASNSSSHAEGFYTTASARYAHAEGGSTTASGIGSHAEGYSVTASGQYSHADGYHTIASGDYQHVSGKYNASDNDKAEIVGGGTSDSRRNIRTLDWSGNEVIAGSLSSKGLNVNGGESNLYTPVYVYSGINFRSGDLNLGSHVITASSKSAFKITLSAVPSEPLYPKVTYSLPYDVSDGADLTYVLATVKHIDDLLANGSDVTGTFLFTRGGITLAGYSKITFDGSQDHMTANQKSNFSIRLGPAGGFYTWYNLPYDYTDGEEHKMKRYTIATRTDVNFAEKRAKDYAKSYTDGQVDGLKTNFVGNVGTFHTLDVETLNATNFNVTNTTTTNTSIENKVFELAKGNQQSLLNTYVGTVVPNYDAEHTFFYGLNSDTFVLGDCTVTRDPQGNVIDVTAISLMPLAVRDYTENFTNNNLVKAVLENGSITFKDAGINPTQFSQAEARREEAEAQRIAAETARQEAEETRNDSEEERLRLRPSPISMYEYGKLRDGDAVICIYPDGHQSVESAGDPTDGYVYKFSYSPDAVYDITDDTDIQEMLATVSDAQEAIDSQVHVTPEQYAELERQGLIDPDKSYFIQDNELYDTLVEAGEQEPIRQENEEVRQDNLKADIENYPYAITQAQFNLLDNGGVFGVHFTNNVKVITVYASAALAEAAEETYIFPMNPDLEYPAKDVGGDSPYLNIPAPPQSDGTYVQKCTVSNGVVTYFWEAE